jgi:hypothetical protein
MVFLLRRRSTADVEHVEPGLLVVDPGNWTAERTPEESPRRSRMALEKRQKHSAALEACPRREDRATDEHG